MNVWSPHLVAVFASINTENEWWFEQVFLSFLTFEDEANHSAAEHKRYMDYVLDL